MLAPTVEDLKDTSSVGCADTFPSRGRQKKRTSDARPYNMMFFAELSFKQWQYTEKLRRR